MTTADITPYDWGLELQTPTLEVPGDQTWGLLGAYDRAAKAEDEARQQLQSYLASINLADPPIVGDLVTPWTLLRETDAPRYPIIDILLRDDDGQPLEEPGYVVRLSPAGRSPKIAVYGPGGFHVAVRVG